MSERYIQINDLLSNYSLGNFDYKVELSPDLDEIDTIISGINMLGEELKATTISKNYFNDIFNSVSDMVFVLKEDGSIGNVNEAVSHKFSIPVDQIIGKNVQDFIRLVWPDHILNIKTLLGEKSLVELETNIQDAENESVPVLCSISELQNHTFEDKQYLMVARDISRQKETESLVIRTIVDTQEQERARVAKDLHDSLGQQISAIRFYLGTLASMKEVNHQRMVEILNKSSDALVHVMSELRGICFNLMPEALNKFGLRQAVVELSGKLQVKDVLMFDVNITNELPPLEKTKEIAIFRIIQEFINNTIKHAKAQHIMINIQADRFLHIHLKDDGVGFDMNERDKFNGMGLKNMRSRVQSYKGDIEIFSQPGKGTEYIIRFPITPTTSL